MNIAIISYSLTGNNGILAAAVAKALSAEHIRITERKSRKTGTIILDMIFNRTPKIQPSPAALGKYDQILLMGPVWMGQAASPLRAYLKYLKVHPQPFGFASISGGAMNTNLKLSHDLEKRAGAKPAAFVDLHIADLLPPEPEPTMKDTSAYHLNDAEISQLAETIVDSVKTQWDFDNFNKN